MSRFYDDPKNVPGKKLAERLEALSDALMDRDEDWQREFTMRIPAEVDRDADIVLAEAARRLRELEGE